MLNYLSNGDHWTKLIQPFDVGTNRMEIKQTRVGNYITLQPKGELDANSSIVLDEVIQKLIGEDQVNIHVNFSEVQYISSAGMGVFISYIDEIKSKGGKIILSQMSENVKDVFELLGLNQIIPIVDQAEVEKMFT